MGFRHLDNREATRKLASDDRLVMASAQAAGASTSNATPGYEEAVELMVANRCQGQRFIGA